MHGKNALTTGANVLKVSNNGTNVLEDLDKASGRDLKQSIKTRGKEAMNDAKDKVTKADGTNLDVDGVVNNFLHRLFKQVNVYLKEKQVRQAMGTCSYRSRNLSQLWSFR